MLYSCTHIATVGVRGLIILASISRRLVRMDDNVTMTTYYLQVIDARDEQATFIVDVGCLRRE